VTQPNEISDNAARRTDEQFLQLALDQARAAAEAGEVPIGAVLVRGGIVIASGQNRVIRDSDPTAHAEIVALREAGRQLSNYRLTGCELFVTLEPCAMCASAMTHARISRLIYAASDPKAGADGSVLQVLNHPAGNHEIDVSRGLLAEKCGSLLREFFVARR
jgi:tRNA(adenine34) deaminase